MSDWKGWRETKENKLSLKQAIEKEEDAATIQSIIDQDPSLACEIDSLGRLPIHYACLSRTSLSAVQVLVDAFPSGLAIQDSSGNLPMHCLFLQPSLQQYMSKLHLLVSLHPEQCIVANKNKATPLDLASSNTQALLLFLESYELCAMHQFSTGGQQSLLHLLVNSHSINNSVGTDVIKLCIQLNTNACTWTDSNQQTPLHKAVVPRINSECIKILVDANPDAIKMQDVDGNTPIHLASQSQIDIESLQYMIKACPEACMIHNNDGNVPLHLLAENVTTTNITKACQVIVTAQPICQEIINYSGLLPVQAAAFCWNSNVINYFAQHNPGIFTIQSYNGYTTLHWAIHSCAKDDRITTILNACPECARILTHDGESVLHLAIQMRYNLDVIQQLYNAFPQSVHLGPNKQLPIHYAVLNFCVLDVLQFLIDVHPESLTSVDAQDANTPLHLALAQDCPYEMIELLLLEQQGKDALYISNNLGNMPLHVAVSCRLDNHTAVMLINAGNAAAVRHYNNDKMLPLHLAFCGNFTDRDVVQTLIDAYPEALEMSDGKDCLAFMYPKLTLDILYLLIRQSMFLFV